MDSSLGRRRVLQLTSAGVLGTALVGRTVAQRQRTVIVHPAGSSSRRGAVAAVRERQGRVRYTYENFEFIAASIPPSRRRELREDRRVRKLEDDGEVFLDDHKDKHEKGNEKDKSKGPEKGTCDNQPAQEPTWGYERINADIAHEYATGAGVDVAVIDSGIQSDHCDLAGGVGAGTSCLKNDPSSEDSGYHGTHVGGIIGARKNDVGVVGVAPEVTLHSVKVFGKGGTQESTLLCALDWCIENEVEIISMSLGTNKAKEAMKIAHTTAYDAGHLMVASAGNDGNDEDGSCEEDNVNPAPGGLTEVIAVSAMNSAEYDDYPLAFFSSVGPEVELMAPGLQINSTVPVNNYDLASGTSMACPFVSGAAALAWERVGATGPDVQARDRVRQALRDTAEDIHGCEDGFGLVRPDRLVQAL